MGTAHSTRKRCTCLFGALGSLLAYLAASFSISACGAMFGDRRVAGDMESLRGLRNVCGLLLIATGTHVDKYQSRRREMGISMDHCREEKSCVNCGA